MSNSIITIIYQNAFVKRTKFNIIQWSHYLKRERHLLFISLQGNKVEISTNQLSLIPELTLFFFFFFLSFLITERISRETLFTIGWPFKSQCQYGHRSKWQTKINHNSPFPSFTLRLAFIGFNSQICHSMTDSCPRCIWCSTYYVINMWYSISLLCLHYEHFILLLLYYAAMNKKRTGSEWQKD